MSGISCARLLQLSLACATTLNTQRMTVATHVDQFLQKEGLSGGGKDEDKKAAETIREIVYGLQRYKKLLSLTTDGLYAKYSSQIARSDRLLYEIFTLLSVYKLDELGLAEFRLFVLSQEAHKMHCLLSFLFTPEMQSGWLRDQWSTVYDPTHVDQVLLGGLKKHEPIMSALVSELAATIAHATAQANGTAISTSVEGVPKVPKKESTVPEPFALTQPKVKMLPAPPIQMDAVYKASPIPAPSPSLQEIETEALARRRATEEKTNKKHAGAKAPRLSTDQRALGTHTASEKLRLELEAKERAINQPLQLKPPPPVREVPQAKGTVATILREDLLYKKKQEEKLAELAKFETELRDEEAFHSWQLKMEALDDAKKAEEIQARKEASRLSAIEAVKAMAQAAEEKHKVVCEIREDLRLINIEKEQAIKKTIKQKQVLVSKIKEEKLAIPLAVQEVITKKIQLAEEIATQKIEAEKQAKKAKAVELAQKKQLIREIQAMESLANTRAKRPKEIDPTSTSGYGFLDEMSLVELQSRLTGLAEREAVFLREKRERILEEKSKKSMVLQEMQRTAALMRKERKSEFIQAKAERVQSANSIAHAQKLKSQQEQLVLDHHLKQTKEQRLSEALRLVKELKSKKIQNEFYTQAKVALAAEREEDLQRAKERVEATAQATQAENERKSALEAYTAEKNRLRMEKLKQREREKVRLQADKLLHQHRKDHIELVKEDEMLKKINRQEIKAAVATQIQVHRASNPYAKSIAEREAKRAAIVAKRSSQSTDGPEGDDDFIPSASMMDEDERLKIAQLDVAASSDTDEEEEEAKQQQQPSTTHLSRTASAGTTALDEVHQTQQALKNITIKRSSQTGNTTKTSARGNSTTKTATLNKQQLPARG